MWDSNLLTISQVRSKNLPSQSRISITTHNRSVDKEEPKVVRMWESSSTQPNMSDNLTPRVSTTTQPSGNDKYTRHTHVPVTTPILKSPHIDNNVH